VILGLLPPLPPSPTEPAAAGLGRGLTSPALPVQIYLEGRAVEVAVSVKIVPDALGVAVGTGDSERPSVWSGFSAACWCMHRATLIPLCLRWEAASADQGSATRPARGTSQHPGYRWLSQARLRRRATSASPSPSYCNRASPLLSRIGFTGRPNALIEVIQGAPQFLLDQQRVRR
jgi:hypothetical protein